MNSSRQRRGFQRADQPPPGTARAGRPLGPIALALMAAAATPGTVVELAQRAQVGSAAARVTCSRLLSRGLLVVDGDGRRPARLVVPNGAAAADGQGLGAVIGGWRS